ncbi:MAG: DUF1592 domain-containing protein, partial [Myxococcota bacterium]
GNGFIEQSFNFGETSTVTIQARGREYNGWPVMKVFVEGESLGEVSVNSDQYAPYTFTVERSDGAAALRIVYDNDEFGGDGLDRDLIIADVTVSVSEAAPLPDELASELESVSDDAFVLTGYEMAALLSFSLTGSTPDDVALGKAESGELLTAASIVAESERLLATPAARAHIGSFATDWLGTDEVLSVGKNAELFPDFDASVRESMLEEVEQLFLHVLYTDAPPSDLLDATYAVVNGELANFYGLSTVPASGFEAVDGEGKRGGLLRTGAFLASNAGFEDSSLIQRAVRIRNAVMCQDIPPPGDAIVNSGRSEALESAFSDLTPTEIEALSTREYVERQTSLETCATCHETMINPLGGGFESYDAIGRYRTTDNGQPVDTSGALIGISEVFNTSEEVTYDDVSELGDILAGLEEPDQCLAENVVAYMASSQLSVRDACILDPLVEQLDGGSSLSTVFEQVGALETVRFRQ